MKQAKHVFTFMKKYAPGFEHAVFMGTAATVGLRETRHIEGEYTLTADDVISCRVPEDTIAVLATSMDTHNKDNESGTYYVLENGPFYGVPYSCLVPKKAENLLVAGRSISADETAASTVRMIPCCIAFGQAAGTAAAMAVEKKISPRKLDAGQLRGALEEQGVYLGK